MCLEACVCVSVCVCMHITKIKKKGGHAFERVQEANISGAGGGKGNGENDGIIL